MSFIDSAFKSLADMIPDDSISKAVSEQISGFDKRIKALEDLMSFGLDGGGAYSELFKAASDISTSISGVCLAIAVVMAYVAIVKEGISLRGDWKKVVTILLRLAITKGLIDSATLFVSWIYSFPAKITSLAINATTNKGEGGIGENVFETKALLDSLGITKDSTFFDKLFALLSAKILGYAFYFLSIAIFVIVVVRIIKIYTMLSFSALAFAKIPLYGIDSCKEYIKEMAALGLQGGMISVTICIYQMTSVLIPKIVDTGTFGYIGISLVLAIAMVMLVFKSEEMARKVV